jgi:transposase
VDSIGRSRSGSRDDARAVWTAAAVPTKLDAYKAILETRLAAYPALSAVRLLAKIRAAGYDGSYTQLKAVVRQIRPTPAPEPVIRFETPAGRQAQVDFARFSFVGRAVRIAHHLLCLAVCSSSSPSSRASAIPTRALQSADFGKR